MTSIQLVCCREPTKRKFVKCENNTILWHINMILHAFGGSISLYHIIKSKFISKIWYFQRNNLFYIQGEYSDLLRVLKNVKQRSYEWAQWSECTKKRWGLDHTHVNYYLLHFWFGVFWLLVFRMHIHMVKQNKSFEVSRINIYVHVPIVVLGLDASWLK